MKDGIVWNFILTNVVLKLHDNYVPWNPHQASSGYFISYQDTDISTDPFYTQAEPSW